VDGRDVLVDGVRRMIRQRSPEPMWALANRARKMAAARVYLRGCASIGAYTQVTGRVRVHHGGTIIIGSRVRIHSTVVAVELAAMPGGVLEIGDGTFVNYGVSISCHESVRIGRNCLLGTYVNILDNTWHDVQDHNRLPPSRPVVIEDNVWLGNRVIVLPGVTIGHNAVIGAGAVVARDIPPCSVAVGMPAQVVRSF
jgi:acetyltransferase-like isoleucine patch superfamily enzyme